MSIEEFVFLDIEASGLHQESYPIQIGYAWPTMDLRRKAFLIRPIDDWTFWSTESEAVHGISRQQLLDEGISVHDAIDEMEGDLAGKRVCSDVPEWDGFWLTRLYRAADRVRTKGLEGVENAYSAAIMEAEGSPTQVSVLKLYNDCERWATQLYPHTHKADEDAQQHAAMARALFDSEFRNELRRRHGELKRLEAEGALE